MVLGAGTGTLPTALATGTTAQVLGGGTSPAWVGGSNGQYLTVSGGALTFGSVSIPTTLTPISKSSSYAAVNGNLVNMTATGTITSPAAAGGATFGVIANYGATNASPVTLTTASGYFIGPGIPASTASILLGALNAQVIFVSEGTNWYLTGGAQDSGWITPSLTNSWTDSNVPPAYRKIANRVTLRGNLSTAAGGSTGTSAFAIPSGYQPAIIATLVAASPGATAAYVTASTGLIVAWTGSSTYLSLDGMTYLTD
jgi:hypothetical protein